MKISLDSFELVTGKKEEPSKYLKGISVIIAAYKTINYIDGCLESVYKSDWFEKHKNYEVIVIVDGDKELYEHLKETGKKYKNFRLLYIFENVGTYVAFNTAAKIAKYDKLFRFDSDDTLYPNAISALIRKIESCDAVYSVGNRFDKTCVVQGAIFIRHSVFDKFGGFQPWPVSADSELRKRLEKYARVKVTNTVLLTITNREDSLVYSEETGLKSPLRQAFIKIIKRSNYPIIENALIEYRSTTNYKEYRIK